MCTACSFPTFPVCPLQAGSPGGVPACEQPVLLALTHAGSLLAYQVRGGMASTHATCSNNHVLACAHEGMALSACLLTSVLSSRVSGGRVGCDMMSSSGSTAGAGALHLAASYHNQPVPHNHITPLVPQTLLVLSYPASHVTLPPMCPRPSALRGPAASPSGACHCPPSDMNQPPTHSHTSLPLRLPMCPLLSLPVWCDLTTWPSLC